VLCAADGGVPQRHGPARALTNHEVLVESVRMNRTEPEIVDGVDLTPGAHQDWRGVDLTLIRHCLSLTPTERLAENEQALELVLELERARDGTR